MIDMEAIEWLLDGYKVKNADSEQVFFIVESAKAWAKSVKIKKAKVEKLQLPECGIKLKASELMENLCSFIKLRNCQGCENGWCSQKDHDCLLRSISEKEVEKAYERICHNLNVLASPWAAIQIQKKIAIALPKGIDLHFHFLFVTSLK